MQENKKTELATFGAGCFWGVEEAFRHIRGVKNTAVGFMGGNVPNPTYEEVRGDKTGYIEVVQIEYDPLEISYINLLEVFWKIHDPTALNKQGLDVGLQYRSVIFFHTSEQDLDAKNSRENLERYGKYKDSIKTEIRPAQIFYKAEEYHQKYLEKKGLDFCH